MIQGLPRQYIAFKHNISHDREHFVTIHVMHVGVIECSLDLKVLLCTMLCQAPEL